MLFAIGFAAVCGLCVYGFAQAWILPGAAIAGISALMFFVRNGEHRSFKAAAWMLLGCAAGFLWYVGFQSRILEPAASLHGKTETVTVHATGYGTPDSYGVEAEGILKLHDRSYRVMLTLDEELYVEPGMEITAPFRFSFTAPREEPISWYSGNGIFLRVYQKGDAVTENAEAPALQDRIAVFRQYLKNAIRASFPEDTYPFAQALLLGDTSALDYETDTNFKISGIRHIIAVSGLHVSILIGMLSNVTFRKKYLMAPLGMAVLFVFSALAGFSPSVVRAALMSALILLGILLNREYDGATALSFAVLVMLLGNPLVIASVSFQLSVASVAGIYLFSDRIRSWILFRYDPFRKKHPIRKSVRIFASSASVTLSAMVLTTPLCAWYFGMVSLVSVVTNLLALWVISAVFYGIMAVCLLFAFWPTAAAVLAWVIAWPIRYVLTVADLMACIPMAAVYTDSIYIVFWQIFVYLLLALYSYGKLGSLKQLLCCSVLGLCMAQMLSWNQIPDDKTAMTVLDVGQGQCILIHSEGRTCMIDCGGYTGSYAADQATEYLLSRGIRRLDGLILTHLDDDHAGGVVGLLSRIDTDLLILPPVPSELTAGTTVYAAEDLCLDFGNGKMTVYTPTFPGTANEKSLCVLFESENCAILITGDRDGFGERMLLRNHRIPDVNILVAGHHGSAGSSCKELLSAVRPETVCISAGKHNIYGHPAPALLERLEQFGCTVYRTDKHGTITLRR